VFSEQLGNVSDPATPVVRVLICDDHMLVRRSLVASLEDTGAAEVVAEVSEGGQAVADARRCAPDVAFVSLVLPDMAGTETLRLIAEVMPGIRLVALTVEESPEERIDGFRAGTTAVIDKDVLLAGGPELDERIIRGSPVVDPATAATIADRFDDMVADDSLAALSGRERRVLAATSAGLDRDAAADSLTMQVGEVRNHLLNVLYRLHRFAPLTPRSDAGAFLSGSGS
jgi:DNA-binding NarL/FixJ family response regulator